MSPPPLANSSVLSVAQTSRAIPSASGILATPPLTPGAATTPAALAPPGASASTIAQATNTAATGTSAPINGAPTHTQYVVARNFNVHDRQNDYTAFLASQATWSEHNLPPTMGQADLVWSQLKTGELRYLLDAAGQKIMGPRGKYLRDFGHILPDRIATNYEPWLDEVWRRMEPRLTHGDIRDRMFMGGTLAGPSNKPTPIRDNTQNQRAVRYRAKVGAFSTKNPRKNSDIQKCELAALDRMSGLQRQYNTTWIVVALENEEGMGMVQPIPADLSAPNYTGTIYPVSISGPGSTHSPNERMRARIAEENRLNNLATSGGLPDWKSLPPQTWADTRGHGDRKARQQASMVAAIAPGNETTRRVESERQSNATKFGNNGAPSDGPRAQPASSVMALGKRKADANECDTEKQVAKRTKGAVKCDQKPAETCQISPSVIRGRVTAKRDRVLRIPKTYKNTADVHSENRFGLSSQSLVSDVGYPVTGQLGWNAQTGYGDAVGNQCLPDWIVRPAPTTVNTDGSMNSVGFFDNDNAFNVERTPAPLCYVDPVECDPLLSATGPSTVQNTGWAELNHPQAMNALESVDTTSARGWPQNTGLANPREEEDFFNYLDMLPASEDFFSQSQTSNGDFTSSSNDAGFNHAAFPSEQNSNQESSFTSSSLDVHPSFLSFADTNGALHGIPMPDSRDPTLPSDFFQFPSDTEYFNNDMAFQLDPHSVADSQQDGDTTTVATSDVQAEPELYGGLTEQELLDALTAGCS